jgi:hypothetical protein
MCLKISARLRYSASVGCLVDRIYSLSLGSEQTF